MVTADILVRLLLIAVGAYLFLFLFWRSLKDEMEERSIFAHGFIILVASCFTSIIFSQISHVLPPTRIFTPNGMWLWGGFVGFLAASTFTWYFSPFPAHYLLEVLIPAALLWLVFVGSVYQTSLAVLSVVCLALFLVLKKNYKKIHRYRSGKVGFAALLTLAFFFMVKAAFAIAAPTMIFSIGQVEVLLSAVVIFLSLFSLYHLAQP